MNAQKVYLISKDAVQNIPDAMIGTGLLTIKNMGLFTSIEIVDSNKQQYIWGGWNSSLHQTGNNYLYNCIHFQVPKSVPHDTTHMCAFQ